MTALDMLAFIIALGVSLTLIITTALQNARLTRSRDEWRRLALEAEQGFTRYADGVESR
jgi:hypothetical protein